jgi:hypothetical protein
MRIGGKAGESGDEFAGVADGVVDVRCAGIGFCAGGGGAPWCEEGGGDAGIDLIEGFPEGEEVVCGDGLRVRRVEERFI